MKKPKIHLVGGCATTYFDPDKTGKDTGVSESGPEAFKSHSDAALLASEFLETIIRSLDASAGAIRMSSPGGGELRLLAAAGMPVEILEEAGAAPADCGVCGKSAASGKLEISDAAFCAERYGSRFFSDACKYVLAVPLANAQGEAGAAGVLTLFFAAETVLTDAVRRTLQSYADLLQISLRNVEHSEDTHHLSLLAERQSIANEIHDSLAQTLYFAKIRASLLLDAMKSDNELLAFKCAQDIDEALESSQKTVRELVTHFRCQMDPRGLQFALQKLVHDFRKRTGISLDFDNLAEGIRLPLEFELQTFLIVREALVNIATHSGATKARLHAACDAAGCFRIVVEDNGGGVASGKPLEGHYGLEIMHERAARIGGAVQVEGLQGMGTRVVLTFNAPGGEPEPGQ